MTLVRTVTAPAARATALPDAVAVSGTPLYAEETLRWLRARAAWGGASGGRSASACGPGVP